MTNPANGVTISLSRDTELALASILGDAHYVSNQGLARKILPQLRQGSVLTISLAEHRQLRDLLDSYLYRTLNKYEFTPAEKTAILAQFDETSNPPGTS